MSSDCCRGASLEARKHTAFARHRLVHRDTSIRSPLGTMASDAARTKAQDLDCRSTVSPVSLSRARHLKYGRKKLSKVLAVHGDWPEIGRRRLSKKPCQLQPYKCTLSSPKSHRSLAQLDICHFLHFFVAGSLHISPHVLVNYGN